MNDNTYIILKTTNITYQRIPVVFPTEEFPIAVCTDILLNSFWHFT